MRSRWLLAEVGLTIVDHCDDKVGLSIRDFYLHGVGLKAYKQDLGVKLVFAFLFRKHVEQVAMKNH
jgi:hypothetical protein